MIRLKPVHWFSALPWRALSLWSTARLEERICGSRPGQSLVLLYAAYGQIGEVPPVAHRHQDLLEHRRNRSFYPTQRSRGGGSLHSPLILPPTPADVLFPRHRKKDNEEGVDVGALGVEPAQVVLAPNRIRTSHPFLSPTSSSSSVVWLT